MGKPIPLGSEYFVKIYLRNGLKISKIARLEHCSRMTVRAIKRGRTVKRTLRQPEEEPGPVVCDPYICPGCSEVAGYPVRVGLRPCVACEARDLRRNLRNLQHNQLATIGRG